MGITVNDLPWEVVELAGWLKEGKPELGWKGDPRLYLAVGVIRTMRAGWEPRLKRNARAGEPVAFRYEVWRHCEDGEDRQIGHWNLDEWHEILNDLVKMDPRTPGHVSTVDEIHKHNEALERDNSRKFQEAYGEAIAHAWDVWHDRNNPRHKFRGMPGGEGETADRNLAQPDPE